MDSFSGAVSESAKRHRYEFSADESCQERSLLSQQFVKDGEIDGELTTAEVEAGSGGTSRAAAAGIALSGSATLSAAVSELSPVNMIRADPGKNRSGRIRSPHFHQSRRATTEAPESTTLPDSNTDSVHRLDSKLLISGDDSTDSIDSGLPRQRWKDRFGSGEARVLAGEDPDQSCRSPKHRFAFRG